MTPHSRFMTTEMLMKALAESQRFVRTEDPDTMAEHIDPNAYHLATVVAHSLPLPEKSYRVEVLAKTKGKRGSNGFIIDIPESLWGEFIEVDDLKLYAEDAK